MEAKDTVMSDKEIRTTHPYWNGLSDNAVKRVRVMAEAQAEISFKIGKTAGVAECLILSLKAMEDSHKAGMRVVVDWINSREEIGYLSQCGFSHVWQGQLKEWGIS